MKKLLLYLFLLFNITPLFSQQIKIILKDADSNETIPFANISIETLNSATKKYQITDKNGQLIIPSTQKTIISISCIGYEPLTDTIQKGIHEKEYLLKPSIYELSTAVVTAQYKPVSVDKSIYDIKLIGKDRIETKAAVNLADILSDELSSKLSNDPSTGTSLNLQGISGENIKILVDGVPVIGRLEGNIDLSQINLENVSHIEIVEGPMSVVYGNNALGGVINIITNKVSPAKFNTELNSYYESVGTYNFNLSTYTKHKNHSFEINAGRNFFSGYSNDTTRSMQWKPKEQYKGSLSYNYRKDNTKLRFKSDLFRERLLDRNDASAPYYEEANDTWYRTIRLNNSLELSKAINNNSNFNLLTAFSYYERTKKKYLVDLTNLSKELTVSPSDHDTSVFNAFMARGVYSFMNDRENFSVQSGFDLNYETAEGKRIENNTESIGDYAVFSTIMWKPFKNFTLQPGLRAAYNTKYNAPLTPSVNLMYKPGKTTIRASWVRGFRSPSLKELYLYFYDSNHQIEGNENLQSEHSHNVTLSANQEVSLSSISVYLDAKTYYNYIDNKISLVQVDPDNALHYRNENTGSFESIGIETSGTLYYGTRLVLKAGYSRIGRKDEAYDASSFIFSNNINSSATLSLPKNLAKLSVYYKFTGKYPVYYYNDEDEIMLGHANGFHNMDISINKKTWNNRITITTGVKNIFDNKEINGVGIGTSSGHGSSDGISSLVGWGRTYFVGLIFNFIK